MNTKIDKGLMPTIDSSVSPDEVSRAVAILRENKRKKEQIIDIVEKALSVAHDYLVGLFLEKALIFQHEVMEERNKPSEKQDKKKITKYIKRMVQAIEEAKKHVEKYDLKRWQPRIFRFLGRAADYNRDYKKAIEYYKKAIKYAKDDIEYILEKIPRWLEYEAFLAFSLFMSGKTKEGFKKAKDVYRKFLDTKEGRFLKKIDYPTWAIWMTGIPIRVGFCFVENNKNIDKKHLLDWLKEAEGYLRKPAGSGRWKGKVDFQFRKNEIEAIRREIA